MIVRLNRENNIALNPENEFEKDWIFNEFGKPEGIDCNAYVRLLSNGYGQLVIERKKNENNQ